MRTTLSVVLLTLMLSAVAHAQTAHAQTAHAQTSEDNARLKNALKRFPAADANQDGVLTIREATAFRNRQTRLRDRATARPAQAPDGGTRHFYKEVGTVRLPLYVYEPSGQPTDAKRPAIVFFFGGGWKSGSPGQFENHCKYLASRGMVAITVEYRVSSRHDAKVEDCIEDAKSAMRWVRANASELGVDPDRIASGGGSAGGHLAACTAVIEDFNASTDPEEVSSVPNAMVLFNPALGPAPEASALRDAQLRNALGDRTRGPVGECLPITYASKPQPPSIIFFGTDDRLLAGAKHYCAKSEKAGNRCRIVTYEGQGHGFFNYRKSAGKYYRLTVAETDKFLVELGWLPENTDPE